MPESNEPDEPSAGNKPSFLQVMMSVLAAAIGVQSAKNRERDFSQSSPMPYIVGGLIFTVLFVCSIIGVVMLVVP
ncbi:MAG: hypothetical protein ACJAX5_001686 [Patiriisocius sp.]|jgi:hypothetical protein